MKQTLDRGHLCVPPERTVVVTMAGQGSYMRAELRHEPRPPHVLEQPTDRGTAAAILLAAHWIQARDPEASMMVLPSDHFVSDDGIFMERVAEALDAIACHPDQIVLLGAEPREPETDYGWIELGARFVIAGTDRRVTPDLATFANGAANSFDGSAADVADGEHARHAGLEWERCRVLPGLSGLGRW